MQQRQLTLKPLMILGALLIITVGLLVFSVRIYNKTLHLDKKNNQPKAQAELDIIPISVNDPIQGNPAAPITIIGFEDFLCEACRTQHTLISEILASYPTQAKFIWKDLSISTIPNNSELIHVYGFCMNEQGYFDAYKDIVFSNIIPSVTPTLLDTIAREAGANMETLVACTQSEAPYTHLNKNKQLARALNIQSTPTFFVQGKQITTPKSILEWKSVLGITE